MAGTKVALITGINGQDGSYLSELLLEKGYFVYGIIRRMSCINTVRIDPLYSHPHFKVFYGDMTDVMGIKKVLDTIYLKHFMNRGGGASCGEVLEVYHLAAQTHVKVSFEIPEYTFQVNAMGTLNLLELLRTGDIPLSKIRFYQACTSEMYGGGQEEKPMNEETPFQPVSPYAISKLMAYHVVKMYRSGYHMYACNGILFNHESPRRGETFVTRKVVIGVGEIMAGKRGFLELGNLDSIRDWGHARDYVAGMWRMLQEDVPKDYVLGTGTTTTVREFVEKVFRHYGVELTWEGTGLEEVGKDRETGTVRVVVRERYFRPMEVPYLQADYSKAKRELGWEPVTSMEAMIEEMARGESH